MLAKARPWIAGVWWYDLFDDGDVAANAEHRFGLIDRAGVKRPAFEALGRRATRWLRNERRHAISACSRSMSRAGIGILLVVLGPQRVFRDSSHALYEAIYLFHMPLFFFVSGVTFRVTSVGETVRKRARSLLVPYFLMGVGRGECAGRRLGTRSSRSFAECFTVRGRRFASCRCGFCLLCFLFRSARRRCWSGSCVGCRWRISSAGGHDCLQVLWVSALIGGALVLVSGMFARPPFTDASGRPIGLPWSLDLLPFVLAVFVAGVLFCRARMIRECPMPVVVILGACAVLAFLVSNGVSLDLNYRRMTDAFAAVAGIAAGISLVFALATLVARVSAVSRVFAYLGSASLVILLLHSPLQRRVLDVLVSVGLPSWVAVVLSVAITVAADLRVRSFHSSACSRTRLGGVPTP